MNKKFVDVLVTAVFPANNLKIGEKKTVCINPRWTLSQWSLFITEQTEKHGSRSVLSAISGDLHHQVELVLEERE